jgi:methylmalonyl-CoA/ethylmalonyl-CoA epimerase
MKFHHVGIACKDIEEEIVNFSKIHPHITQSAVVYDREQDAHLVMLTLPDGTNLELISGKRVENLTKKGITYYHICFEVEDINAAIATLIEENAFLVSPPKPAILFGNREVAFLQVSYGLIELLSIT